MNVTESLAVNRLLNHIGIERHDDDQLHARVHPPARIVEEAAELLAVRAYRTLSAGLTGEDVRRAWPEVAERLHAAFTAQPSSERVALERIAAVLREPAPTLAKVAGVLREHGLDVPQGSPTRRSRR